MGNNGYSVCSSLSGLDLSVKDVPATTTTISPLIFRGEQTLTMLSSEPRMNSSCNLEISRATHDCLGPKIVSISFRDLIIRKGDSKKTRVCGKSFNCSSRLRRD